MPRQRMPDFIEVSDTHAIATRGIMSIKQSFDGRSVIIRYVTGYTETVTEMGMVELLTKLGRNPLAQGGADSAPPPDTA